MVSLNNIYVSFGGFELLKDVSFSISPRERIGLTGKNGAGKSTLLKIIMGQQSPTAGNCVVPQSVQIGYLPQEMGHAKERSVLDEALRAFDHLHGMKSRMEHITHELSTRTDYESFIYHELIKELNELHDRFDILAGVNPLGEAERTLMGLGFKQGDLCRPTSEFSEGWNMRIELAKLLVRKPDLLLLDEPTNHLDIESIQWFENYLEYSRSAVVVISHDRTFLDNVTHRTIELMLGKAYDYKASYSHYITLRQERIAQQTATWENQQRMIEKTEEFIERFRYKPTKSNQVQSRIKQLEKLERVEIDEIDRSAIHVRFPSAPRSGQVAFKTNELRAQYGPKIVFDKANLTIERGEKVALVGRNGEGKTTLMRIITGALAPGAGTAALGYNVSMGYYAQNQDELLNPNMTVFDTLDQIAVGDIRTKLRDILGAFLFRGEDIDKKVSVLSGGERARLAMAKLMLHPYNLLALDEPTNHMDIKSKEVLKKSLIQYNGTLILVSHDRDFLDGLVDKIYEFREGRVKEHLGGIKDFLYRRKIENLRELERVSQKESKEATKTATDAAINYQEKKEQDRKLRKLRNELDKAEEAVAKLEAQIAEKDRLMIADVANCTPELCRAYQADKKALEQAIAQWEKAHEAFDAFNCD
ncbi:MAG: ABC-F family ATP-binding cassette domain-containing protein [Prevotellaceae bacterium]|nr:ABC-F family ATP-binding cassette domain-containing protein [Prevotellaceae bacterium]